MHCEWVCTILFSGLFSGCSLYKINRTIHLFLCVSEKILYPLYRFPPTWAQGGFPFLDLEFFFLSVCKRCFIQIHVPYSYDFWSLIFLWLVILYLLWQSVVIVTACHLGFYFPTSNAICGRFWANGTIFLSCCLFFCTDPPSYFFIVHWAHIHKTHLLQYSCLQFVPSSICITSNLRFATFQFGPFFTYKFTYLRIHLPKNWIVPHTNSPTYGLDRCSYKFIYSFIRFGAYQFGQRFTYEFPL